MPLDHYVSQVHLRNFYSPKTKRLFAFRKSDLKRFPPRSEDVCRIEDGSTNAYLKDDRIVERFLLDVEPKYNASLAKLRDDKIDQECVYSIAGFAAYVASCAPAAMRIHTEPLKAALQAHVILLDRQGILSKAPEALGGKSATELLADKTIQFNVNEKFPQAIGITTIMKFVSIWGNSCWEILHNDDPETQFLTSDFPAAIELRPDQIINRVIPLAPNLAVRFIPDPRQSRAKVDLSFSGFRYRHRTPSRAEAIEINRLIVQCAEDVVFWHDERGWIAGFVEKHRHFQVEGVSDLVPHGNGFLTVNRQRIVAKRAA